MPDVNLPPPLKLDPWSASSLLQKAIRRGEVELAQSAGLTLYRHRGVATFRRLCTIAVEDIGIADVALLQEVVRIGTDRELRSVLGSDASLICDLAERLALATKDRSADYLICAATKLETALSDRAVLKREPIDRLIGIATDEGVPLVQRAVGTLLACSIGTNDAGVRDLTAVARWLEQFSVKPMPLHDAVFRLARVRADPICLMLPLIWQRWWHLGAQCGILEDELPPAKTVNGIPLYTWDFHTAAGKRAIAEFASDNEQLATALRNSAPEHCHVAVAEIATFYADAAPVSRRLDWPSESLLRETGAIADMLGAGCSFDGVTLVLDAVGQNLSHLNQLRRFVLQGTASSGQRVRRC